MSRKFKNFGLNQNIGRTIFYKHYKTLPLNEEHTASPYFGLFLAVDGIELTDDLVYGFIYNTIKAGMAYVSVWGHECTRLYGAFNEVIDAINANDNISTNEETEIRTFAHCEGSIEKAMYEFMTQESPSRYYSGECKSAYVMSVGDKKQNRMLKKLLKNAMKYI